MIEQVRDLSKLRVLNPQRTNSLINKIIPTDLDNINEI